MTDSSNKDNCHSCGNQLQAGLVCNYEGKLYCTETCRDAFNATPKCKKCGCPAKDTKIEAQGIGIYCSPACFIAENTPEPKCEHCGKPITQEEAKKWNSRCPSSKGTNCYERYIIQKKAEERARAQQVVNSTYRRDPFSPIGTGWMIPQWRVTF